MRALPGRVAVELCCVVLACAAVTAVGAAAPASAPTESSVVGRSVEGRRITLVRRGDPDAARRVLVVGCVHGNECAGVRITRALRDSKVPAGVELLLIDSVNPDGRTANRRQNARGVDLNRNFPTAWRESGSPGDTYYSGPRPLSEPESRVVAKLVRQERPSVSIWYHQHARLVYLPARGDCGLVRRYAERVGLPAREEKPLLRGTAVRWQNANFDGTTAFVVELPAGELGPDAVKRHVKAVRAAARGEGASGSQSCP
jgi:murein peptide amidase A